LTSILSIGILAFLDYRFRIIQSLLGDQKGFFIETVVKELKTSEKSANDRNFGIANVCLTPACVEAGTKGIKLNKREINIFITIFG